MNSLVKLYKEMLKLYPASYRQKYERQMVQTVEDMLDEAHTLAQKLRLYARLCIDTPTSISKQQVIHLGGIMAHKTPMYVKRNGVLSATLLLPFFILVVANTLNQVVFSENPWKPVAYTGIALLPIVAFVISGVTLVRWLQDQNKHGSTVWASLKNISSGWPIISPLLVALLIVGFVFGHDSVHCVVGNPVKVMRNASQTMECVARG